MPAPTSCNSLHAAVSTQCEDTLNHTIVFKKGEIVDVPCHYEHRVSASTVALVWRGKENVVRCCPQQCTWLDVAALAGLCSPLLLLLFFCCTAPRHEVALEAQPEAEDSRRCVRV